MERFYTMRIICIPQAETESHLDIEIEFGPPTADEESLGYSRLRLSGHTDYDRRRELDPYDEDLYGPNADGGWAIRTLQAKLTELQAQGCSFRLPNTKGTLSSEQIFVEILKELMTREERQTRTGFWTILLNPRRWRSFSKRSE